MNISFDNTENAFAYKTDKELKGAKFLFNTMGFPWFVQIGTRLTPFIMKTGLAGSWHHPQNHFKQFVGGETLEETAA
jgi:proline dehydrogenase